MTVQRLDDSRVNVRTFLALLWVCHFILWIFGDMFTLLQDLAEPVTSTALTFVAPATAIVLTLMVVLCLTGGPSLVRVANLVVAPVYILLDIGFMVDATKAWQYFIGIFYILFGVLIIWRAYTWPKPE